jgi:hypothetical protein
MGRSQQGITDGMDEHISIRVPQEAPIMFQTNATEPKLAVLGKLVDIESKSYTYFHIKMEASPTPSQGGELQSSWMRRMLLL